MTDSALDAGRRSFRQESWGDAFRQLSAADRRGTLAIDDIERLAVAAYLVGEHADYEALWTRAHQECQRQGEPRRAARNAMWLGFALITRGDMAPASGWFARAGRILDDVGDNGAERAFLLVADSLRRLVDGDATSALAGFDEALSIAERFGDVEVATLGRLGRGQALVLGGQQVAGVAEFDEVMVAVTAGEVAPMVAGLAYCTVIEFCRLTFDVRRAHEWTAMLSRWCESHPELVPYRGQCLVHRAEMMQFHGAWSEALDEAGRAYEQLSRPPVHPAVGDALYRQAELLRLRGEHGRAEEMYGRANDRGRQPQPGLALLRLAEGRVTAATAAIRRSLSEAVDLMTRSHLLTADVEIMLVAGELGAARASALELDAIAADLEAPVLRAMAGLATGTVLLGEGDGRAALAVLRPAWVIWRDLDAPYEAARVRVAVGLACRQLGDEDGATLEIHAAAGVFQSLGATDDLARLEHLPVGGRIGLSRRELEVLAVVATGKTNRDIGAELAISEKTVARHVANIFTKLGLSSRAAATAYAYEHGLIRQPYTE